MAKYIVRYQEILSRTVIVEADSESEAEDLVYAAVEDCDIVLDADDYDCGSGEATVIREYREEDESWYRWCQKL